MMEFVRIQDSDSLIRDLSSGAVINTNTTDYQNYLARKNSSKDMKQQIKQNSDKIEKIDQKIT